MPPSVLPLPPLLVAAATVLAGTLALTLAPARAGAALPPVKHVFVIVLENKNADSTFGPQSKAPYLARTLTAQGQFIPKAGAGSARWCCRPSSDLA